jgi:hypothetical protein
MRVVDLMNLEDQVDLDFTLARRRARLGRLKALLLRRSTRATLLSPEELRRTVPASGAMYRGRRTVEVSSIVGSLGKHNQFDQNFMPLFKASSEKWKRIDRAFRFGQELALVSLLELGGDYFVNDGNYRVSVARFHGVEWIDAEVTAYKSPSTRPLRHALDRPVHGTENGVATAAAPLEASSLGRSSKRNTGTIFL